MTDFGQERIVDRLLAHVERNGDDERLRELAAGLRNGGADLRGSLYTSAYADALQSGLEKFAGWYEQLDDSERAAQAQLCQQELDDLNRVQASNDTNGLPWTQDADG